MGLILLRSTLEDQDVLGDCSRQRWWQVVQGSVLALFVKGRTLSTAWCGRLPWQRRDGSAAQLALSCAASCLPAVPLIQLSVLQPWEELWSMVLAPWSGSPGAGL